MNLYINLRRTVSAEQALSFTSLIERRIAREPTAYIVGHKEFYGLDFEVDRSVLIPRPETELIVEKAINLASCVFADRCLIADVGTGCGAIAVALAVNLPNSKVYAIDISGDALGVSRRNCRRHGVSDRITLLQGDILDVLPEPVHIIIANLPYVRDSEFTELSTEVAGFEPRLALSGGVDGLLQTRRLIEQAPGYLIQGGAVLLETAPDRAYAVCEIAREFFPGAEISVTQDLSGMDRVVSISTMGKG